MDKCHSRMVCANEEKLEGNGVTRAGAGTAAAANGRRAEMRGQEGQGGMEAEKRERRRCAVKW